MPWDIIGNDRAVSAIARGLTGESPPHAYLFVGPERVGKATLALRLAQALNCERRVGDQRAAPLRPDAVHAPALFPDADNPPSSTLLPPSADPAPCLQCTACTRIQAGLHADVQVVRIEAGAEGDQRTGIAVEQMRDVEGSVALTPYEGRTRVVIIDPADAMSIEAQNAFLKTLEEPPPHVVFILIATREDRLLPTIHSRCRRVEFRLMPASEIEAALAAEGAEAEHAVLLARLARGRPGWALAMARDEGALDRRREVLQAARSVPEKSVADRLTLAEKMLDEFRANREAVYSQLAEWAGWWRDVMLIHSDAEEGVANLDMMDGLRQDASRYSRTEVLAFIHAILAAREQLRSSVQPRPALELLVLEAPSGRL